MKKTLLLFTKRSVQIGQSRPENLCAVLQKAAGDTVSYEYAFYEDLVHVIDTKNASISLPDGRGIDSFDLVYQRRWITNPEAAVSVAIFLRKKGVPCVDTESYHEGSTDKLVQYWRMWEQDIPFPKTIFAPQSTDWLKMHLQEIVGLPCIVKGSNSQRGENNYLLDTVEDVVRVVAQNPHVPFLIQEFIPNDCDYRVFVCGDEIGVVIRRTAGAATHKNNTSQGGEAELMSTNELSGPGRAVCIKAAKVFGRQIAGVDIVFDKRDNSKFYIFEVNRAPQIDTATFADNKAVAINAYFLALVSKHQQVV
jgi:glutathione synthase/RimK-type ligase-like ATP-grasp enzyme